MQIQFTAVFRKVRSGYVGEANRALAEEGLEGAKVIREPLREGAKHSAYVNRRARNTSTVSRHREVTVALRA